MQKVFVSWSGGKDCCLAAYLAASEGLKVSYLANTVSEDGQRSRSHGIPAELIRMQSKAMGIPILQQPVSSDGYETSFKSMIRSLKEKGIEGGVFGDIDFNAHREWIDRVLCGGVFLSTGVKNALAGRIHAGSRTGHFGRYPRPQ